MSSLENILDIDLNSVVSKAIAKQIKSLEKQVENGNAKVLALSTENAKLKNENKSSDRANLLVEQLRKSYAKIEDVKNHKKEIVTPKWATRWGMVKDLALLIHGIVLPERWDDRTYYGYNIAYNAYAYKDIVCDIFAILDEGSRDLQMRIREFTMPMDYPKAMVVNFINNLHYGCNGARFGAVGYWIENGFKQEYLPYDLIMKSPHFVSDECFALVVESIKAKKQYSEDLFALPMHNDAVTNEQIKILGSLAAQIPIKGNQRDTQHGKFIDKYMGQFRKEDIDIFFEKIRITTTDWTALGFGVFPVEYQMVAFRKMTFKGLTDLLGSYSGRWSIEQREAIFADWFYHNPHPHTPKTPSV